MAAVWQMSPAASTSAVDCTSRFQGFNAALAARRPACATAARPAALQCAAGCRHGQARPAIIPGSPHLAIVALHGCLDCGIITHLDAGCGRAGSGSCHACRPAELCMQGASQLWIAACKFEAGCWAHSGQAGRRQPPAAAASDGCLQQGDSGCGDQPAHPIAGVGLEPQQLMVPCRSRSGHGSLVRQVLPRLDPRTISNICSQKLV